MPDTLHFLRHIYIRLFTQNPFKVSGFEHVFSIDAAEAVNVKEDLTQVLHHKKGNYYSLSDIDVPSAFNNPRFVYAGLFKEPDRLIYSITDGYIFTQLGLVYHKGKRTFISESANEWLTHLNKSPYTNAVKMPPVVNLEGITVSFLKNGADAGFYHFLFESLPKAYLYKDMLNKADQLLFNGPPFSWKLKWLERAGLDIAKIIWTDNNSHFRCKQLIFTNTLVTDQQISPWCITALKSILDIPIITKFKNKASNVIWLSRKESGVRNFAWEEEIARLFPAISFLSRTDYTVAQTIDYMQAATHIIAPHGAGLSNLFLCEPETKVLELYPVTQLYKPCYARLAELNNLHYEVTYADFDNPDNEAFGMKLFISTLSKFLSV